MQNFAIQTLALIFTALVVAVGFPILVKLIFTIGFIPTLLIVIGVLVAMAMK